MVDFNKDHSKVVAKIVARARGFAPDEDKMSLTMDIMAANGVNGNDRIDLDALLAADDFNFTHDVFGIIRHMDRETGRIGGFFLPRFARASAAA